MKQSRSLKIALIGTRGVPARHGGFETCVEEIGWRLAERGHRVIVYSKRHKKESITTYRGMKIVYIPRIPVSGLETLFAATLASIHSIFHGYDVNMIFDSANSPVLLLFRAFGKKCAINPDGLGWKREKWGYFARKYYKWVEPLTARFARHIVSDSQAIRQHYIDHYHAESTVIEYGANIPDRVPEEKEKEILGRFGLKKHAYALQITRFEPENNPLLSVAAFCSLQSDLKFFLVGGAQKPTAYTKALEVEAEKAGNILLPGFIYDKEVLNVIWQNSLFYIHGNSVGGTNPALLQAMAAGRPITAIDCVFNRETLGNSGFFFERSATLLSESIKLIIRSPKEAEQYARNALERVSTHYNWERIANLYENLFIEITN